MVVVEFVAVVVAVEEEEVDNITEDSDSADQVYKTKVVSRPHFHSVEPEVQAKVIFVVASDNTVAGVVGKKKKKGIVEREERNVDLGIGMGIEDRYCAIGVGVGGEVDI